MPCQPYSDDSDIKRYDFFNSRAPEFFITRNKGFVDVSIGETKHKNYEKYCFLTQKIVKITKAHTIM
eukprot:UN21214